MESFDNRFTSQVDFNAKKTIDRSVIKPIITDFCDDDSDDDTGWSIIILSIIDREKLQKSNKCHVKASAENIWNMCH